MRALLEQGDVRAAQQAVPQQARQALKVAASLRFRQARFTGISHIIESVLLFMTQSCLLPQDQRLIFLLKKQEVVEYLRKGTPDAQQQALGETAV